MFIAHGSWIRKYSPWLLAGVLVLLLPSFVIMFAPTGGSPGRKQQTIPTIGGKEAPVAEYMKAYNSALVEVKFRFGDRAEALRAFAPQISRQAVQWMLLWREAEKLGLSASNDEIRKQIELFPDFKNEAGQYDWYRYTAYLQGRGIKEADFENYLRGQTVIDRLYDMVTSGVNITPIQLRQDYNAAKEKCKIELISFNASSYTNSVKVTDEEVQAYYEAKKDQYRTPDRVNVRYAFFGFDDAQKRVKVTDEQVKSHFDENAENYKNEDGTPKTLDAVKDTIRTELAKKMAKEMAANNATQFTIDVQPEADGAAPDFAKIATKYQAAVRETGFFSGTNTLTGVNAPNFSRAAFALFKAGGAQPFSEPVEGEDGIYVLQYLGGQPGGQATVEQAKAEVIGVLKAQKSLQSARTAASDAIKQLKDGILTGKSFADIAKDKGYTVIKPEPFSQTEGGKDIPNSQLLKSAVRPVRTGEVNQIISADGAAIFYLTERIQPTDEQFAAEKDAFAKQQVFKARQDAWRLWVDHLITQAKVSFGDEPQASAN
jgi:peptidyl-prolyl cis-trans isomerase D